MTLFFNRVRVSTATVGVGTLALGQASVGYFSFTEEGVPNGALCTYTIEDGNNVEVGRGVYASGPQTLTRAQILRSKINGQPADTTPLSLSGSAIVFITAAAEDLFRGPTGIVDNAVQRTDGTTGLVLQSSGVIIDDSNNVSGVVNFTQTGYQDLTEMVAPAAPAANVGRIYAVDDGTGLTTLTSKNSAGTLLPITHYNRGVTGSITRRAFDKFQDEISVMDFIPEGDHAGIRTGSATTDLTAYIQAAIDYLESIDYASAANGRPALKFPAGRYFSGALTCDKHMGFLGDGRHSTIIRLIDGVTGSLFTLNAENVGGTSIDDTNHYYFKGITLSGNRVDSTTTGTSRGIYCPDAAFAIGTQYGPSVLLDDVEVLGFTGDGVHLGVNRNWALIDHTIIRYCNDNGFASYGFDYRVTNCDFGVNKNFGWRAFAGGNHFVSGIAAYSNTMAMVVNSAVNSPMWIVGCDFVGNLQHGISVASATAPVTILACKFNSNSSSATNTYDDILITDTEGCKVALCDFVYDGVVQSKYLVETSNVDTLFWDNNSISTGTNPYGTGVTNDNTKLAWAGDTENNFFLRPGSSGPSIYSGTTQLTRWGTSEHIYFANHRLRTAAPRSFMEQTGAAANSGRWMLNAAGNQLDWYCADDAETGFNAFMTVTRAAAVPSLINFPIPVKTLVTTVAALPAAATAGAGARAFVTNALAPAFGAAVAAGGAVSVPVYSTGAAWNVG